MYIAVVQNNPTVGALEQNAETMLSIVDELSRRPYPPDLVIFPAYAMSGMPLDGLTYSTAFQAECLDMARFVIAEAKLPCLFGSVVTRHSRWRGDVAEAEVIYCQQGIGGTLGFADHDGPRFARSNQYMEVKIGEAQVAIFLDCLPDSGSDFVDCDLLVVMLAKEYIGTDVMLTSSDILSDLRTVAQEASAWVVIANLVGGQDDMVFDGGSMVIDPNGSVVDYADVFSAGVIEYNLTFPTGKPDLARGINERQNIARATTNDKQKVTPLLPYEADWKAITLATRDYVLKNGFYEVVIGLSGGIDSALTAVLAVDALGADSVHGVLMPSIFTSETSTTDALELASNLGIDTLTMPINEPVEVIEDISIGVIGDPGSDSARQNMQARMRMLYLMHLSNTFEWMLLNTSNKSEAAMGYSTLYGDTAGAFAPFGNVYKTDIYGMANWRNMRSAVIPSSILTKAPTAELYPGQLDTDSLPPYEVLDRILRLHIEDRMGLDQILNIITNTPGGDPIDPDVVGSILRRVTLSEFKRRQEPLSPSIGSVDMNTGRSWPITNGFIDRNRGLSDPRRSVDLINQLRNWKRPPGWGFMAN